MSRYKYCIVPMCKSTSFATPDKVFINVPNNMSDRNKWCLAMKRDEKKNVRLSEKSTRHVCEDHFNLENDAENYMRHKMQGARIKLKTGVLPHLFDCQKQSKVTAGSTERARKRQRISMLQDLLHDTDDQPCSSTTTALVEEEPVEEEPMCCGDSEQVNCTVDKAVQVKPLHRSKCINTVRFATMEVGCMVTVPTKDACCDPLPTTKEKCVKFSSDEVSDFICNDEDFECASSEDSEFNPEDWGSDSDYEEEIDNTEEKLKIRGCMVSAVRNESQMCLGIPQHINFLIDFLSKESKCPPIHVMITLKKIRMDDSYAYLGMLFGMSVSTIARIFKRTVYRLAALLQNFIIWPDKQSIQRCLPIAFRSRYFKTQSIIDCFEIKIEKPSNPLHQTLTWSEYKKGNTIKYLISCTPDGTVNFVSKGYGGRTTDTVIFEDSGYMDNLIPNMEVMADRGFKNIAHMLLQKNNVLVRPPSVSQDEPMTAEEVKTSKRIAALRIHVERVIGRLKFFQMCNDRIDHNHLQIFDHVVIVVCGLINLQPELIRN